MLGACFYAAVLIIIIFSSFWRFWKSSWLQFSKWNPVGCLSLVGIGLSYRLFPFAFQTEDFWAQWIPQKPRNENLQFELCLNSLDTIALFLSHSEKLSKARPSWAFLGKTCNIYTAGLCYPFHVVASNSLNSKWNRSIPIKLKPFSVILNDQYGNVILIFLWVLLKKNAL